jgi:hypothetical protein
MKNLEFKVKKHKPIRIDGKKAFLRFRNKTRIGTMLEVSYGSSRGKNLKIYRFNDDTIFFENKSFTTSYGNTWLVGNILYWSGVSDAKSYLTLKIIKY